MSKLEHSRCREIYCKTVTGKGRVQSKTKHELEPEEKVSHILGCWVMNPQVHVEKRGHHVYVVGSYEINLWFAYDDNQRTDVFKHKVHFDDRVTIRPSEGSWKKHDCDLHVHTAQPPTCLRAELEDDHHTVRVWVESDYRVEIVSEAKVKVALCHDGDPDDSDWDGEHDEDGE